MAFYCEKKHQLECISFNYLYFMNIITINESYHTILIMIFTCTRLYKCIIMEKKKIEQIQMISNKCTDSLEKKVRRNKYKKNSSMSDSLIPKK